uniref:HAD family hydrolase n=1 Tax=Candidatus Scatocola faecipullorum TaxID=2840917 RepID=UPI00402666B0
MIFCKKNIIWDLDNTLYRITPEFADILDEATAIAAIEDLGVPLDFETAKAKVKESYRIYRDGGEIFVKEYGIDPSVVSLRRTDIGRHLLSLSVGVIVASGQSQNRNADGQN